MICPLHITHCTQCRPVSQCIKYTQTLCSAAVLLFPPVHCMLIFISVLTVGAKEPTPRLNAGLISQVKTLLIDIEYNYITRYAYPTASY